MAKYLKVRSSCLYTLPSEISSLPHYLICPSQTKGKWMVRVYDDFADSIEVDDKDLKLHTTPLEDCDYWSQHSKAYGDHNTGLTKHFHTDKQKYHWRIGLYTSRNIAKNGTSSNPRLALRNAAVRLFRNMPELAKAWPRTREDKEK